MSTTFGRYTLVRRVGTGGMAEIWKAKAQGPAGFEKVLAIKKVLPHLAEDGEFIDMFVAEAKLVATLVHPNIVQVFDFGQVGKHDYFIAMEYVPGTNLALLIRRLAEKKARMPVEVALYIVLEACKALGYAHSRSDSAGDPLEIVHRDVSPQNILVSFGGEVKVTDFGIAKVASALSRTAEGHVRGKLAYMSPEQAATQPLDGRSDLFSLGVVLYELVTGKRLFAGSSSSEIYAKVTGFTPPAGADLGGVPEEIREILGTVLKVDREERYPNAMEMEGALAHCLGPEGIVQARHALSSIVQRLFDEERRLELVSDAPSGSFPAVVPVSEPDDAQTHQQVSGSVGIDGAVESTSATPPKPSGSGPRRVPAPTPNPNPSGLTLADKVKAGQPPIEVIRNPSPARGRPVVMGLAIASVIVLLVMAFASGKYIGGEQRAETGTPAATLAAAVASPASTETAIASVAPSPAVSLVALATATPMQAAWTPHATATPHANPTPRVVHATPTPAPVLVSAAHETAYLTVNAKPWVEVFVDGKLVASETPLRRLSLSAGKHALKFANPAARFSTETVVEIPAGAERSVMVDVKSGSVRVQ